MSTLIAIANQKGGCGKTTTAMNLAGTLTRAQYRVLVVDADPQASAVMWSVARGAGALPFDVQTAHQLRNRFDQLAHDPEYDVVLIDCPPGMVDDDGPTARVGRRAIAEADALLVPLRPSTLDFSAAATFVRFLNSTPRQAHQRVLVLLNGLQPTVISRQAPAQAAVLFASVPNVTLLESGIGLRAPIAEVPGSGATIIDYRPGSRAAEEYANLTKEIITCLAANAPLSPPSTPELQQTA